LRKMRKERHGPTGGADFLPPAARGAGGTPLLSRRKRRDGNGDRNGEGTGANGVAPLHDDKGGRRRHRPDFVRPLRTEYGDGNGARRAGVVQVMWKASGTG